MALHLFLHSYWTVAFSSTIYHPSAYPVYQHLFPYFFFTSVYHHFISTVVTSVIPCPYPTSKPDVAEIVQLALIRDTSLDYGNEVSAK